MCSKANMKSQKLPPLYKIAEKRQRVSSPLMSLVLAFLLGRGFIRLASGLCLAPEKRNI